MCEGSMCCTAFEELGDDFGGEAGNPDTHLVPTGSLGEGCSGVLLPGEVVVGTLMGEKWCRGVTRPEELFSEIGVLVPDGLLEYGVEMDAGR